MSNQIQSMSWPQRFALSLVASGIFSLFPVAVVWIFFPALTLSEMGICWLTQMIGCFFAWFFARIVKAVQGG